MSKVKSGAAGAPPDGRRAGITLAVAGFGNSGIPTDPVEAVHGFDEDHTHGLPVRRSQPLLIKQWKYLWREDFVELRRGLKVIRTGWVDEITADGSTIWICLSSGMGRKMIHNQDGVDIWWVESHICQERAR